MENQDVAVADIPNAFVQTKAEEGGWVIMKLRGKLAEITVLCALEIYTKYIVVENGVPVLYVHVLNALYGTLKAALLFYKKLVNDLKSQGFVLNPYDICVANKMVNGKQLTVCWHVDDLKVSHVDTNEVTNMINWLKVTYEDKIGKMVVSRGKIHRYLGMTLDYSTSGKVKIDMVDYVKKMIEDFPEEIVATAKTHQQQNTCLKWIKRQSNLMQ